MNPVARNEIDTLKDLFDVDDNVRMDVEYVNRARMLVAST